MGRTERNRERENLRAFPGKRKDGEREGYRGERDVLVLLYGIVIA